MQTRTVPSSEGIGDAARLLLAGEVVAVAAETVYGLAGDATSEAAVTRIYEAKGRPGFNPLLVHVASLEMAASVATLDALSLRLAEAFWPGPLTLVLPSAPTSRVARAVTAGLETVAVRHPLGPALDLIARTGRPLAIPSANASGRTSPTTAGDVVSTLGGRIPMVLDSGPTALGIESTILKVSDGRLTLLRAGSIATEDLEAFTGLAIARSRSDDAISAPGMLAAHYAPSAGLRMDARYVEPGEALLAFGPVRVEGAEKALAVANLSVSGNLEEAASRLFACLHDLDRLAPRRIAVEPIPHHGLGEAINDRLVRAVGDRPPNRH